MAIETPQPIILHKHNREDIYNHDTGIPSQLYATSKLITTSYGEKENIIVKNTATNFTFPTALGAQF